MVKLAFDPADFLDISDPREMPAYTAPEVGQYLRIPAATVRAWTRGTTTGKGRSKRPFPAVIDAPKGGPLLSYYNLAEVFVLRELRDRGVPLRHARTAIEYVATRTDWRYPLLHPDLKTDGWSLFLEGINTVVNVSTKQIDLFDFRALDRIEWEEELVTRIYPFTRLDERADSPRPIVIDAKRAFGRPIVDRIGIPTEAIYGRWVAGDTIRLLASDYRCRSDDIEEALCYEAQARAA